MTLIIAEISSNHNQDLDRCLRLFDVAARAGCDAVKLQVFSIEKLFRREVLDRSIEHRNRKKWELPVDFLPILCEAARERGLKFGCTPFDYEALEHVKGLVDFIKIASYELLWLDFINRCSLVPVPIMISTGMANWDEVDRAHQIASAANENVSLLHCVSEYPASPSSVNLNAIQTMKDRYQVPIGWSDHTMDLEVCVHACLSWNAELLEVHIDLDDNAGFEGNIGHCWSPPKLNQLVSVVKSRTQYGGSGTKEPTPAEMADRKWRADPTDGLRPMRDTDY